MGNSTQEKDDIAEILHTLIELWPECDEVDEVVKTLKGENE